MRKVRCSEADTPVRMSRRPSKPRLTVENNMAVGFNMYPSGRFVALYRDPASADTGTEPTAYLNDLTSMPFAATFDDDDNLYIGDSNRARVLIYYNPLNNAPANATASPLPAPLPTYATTITSISPSQPSCVLRDNGMLRLRVAGLPVSGALTVQIRKIAFSDRLDLHLGSQRRGARGRPYRKRQRDRSRFCVARLVAPLRQDDGHRPPSLEWRSQPPLGLHHSRSRTMSGRAPSPITLHCRPLPTSPLLLRLFAWGNLRLLL